MYDYYGLVIVLIALLALPMIVRLRRRVAALITVGWGRLYLGVILFLLAGVLRFIASIPQFMALFLPSMADWFNLASQAAVGPGLILIIWSLTSIYSGVRRTKQQTSDDAGWQELYSHLQELALQPLSFVEVLNMSLKQLVERSGSDGATVLLFKENSEELILTAFANLSPETAQKLDRLPLAGDLFSRAQKLGLPQLVSNLADSDKTTAELFTDTGYLSAAVIPLCSREKTLGSLALFSTRPFYYTHKRALPIVTAANFLATTLVGIRSRKEIGRLKEKLQPSEEAKRITEELFFRRGVGGDLQLREAVEFERVRRFFDADGIKLVAKGADGEFRIQASSGGAELGLLLDPRKLSGLSRAVTEKKLLLLTSPQAKTAGGGYDSMPRQVLFVPVPYPGRYDLVLLLESDTASLKFSSEKLSAVRVASVYLADLHFLFMEKRQGEKYRHSVEQAAAVMDKIMRSNSETEIVTALVEAAVLFLPGCRARLICLANQATGIYRLVDGAGLNLAIDPDGSFTDALAQILKNTTIGETRINKPALSESLPETHRIRFTQAFAGVPEQARQLFQVIREGDSLYGFVILYFDIKEKLAPESKALYQKLVDLAGLRLARLSDREASSISLGSADMDSKLGGLHNSLPRTQERELSRNNNRTTMKPPANTLAKSDSSNSSNGSAKPVMNKLMEGEDVVDTNDRATGQDEIKNHSRKLRILGIDDQEVIRELLIDIISDLGHRVEMVADGGSGLSRFTEEEFDLVIIGAALPDRSGWEIADAVKAHSPRTPVIILSGWDYEESANAAARQSADFIVTKPFRMEQLGEAISAVETLLSH